MRPVKATSDVPLTHPTGVATTEDPELADRFNRVLGDTVEAMEESGLRYIFIGGIASGGLGRPRSTHDIDIFVMPEDAELALRALVKKNFQTERTDRSWIYKGFKEGILVDVIFKSKGEIYLDHEMYGRSITAEFHGKRLRLVAPEDLLIIKAVAHSELTPGHWHDATALLSHANLDWPYLIRRARRAPRRVLSLLLYAQSNDIWVPNAAIHELYQGVFGEIPRAAPPHSPPPRLSPAHLAPPQMSEERFAPTLVQTPIPSFSESRSVGFHGSTPPPEGALPSPLGMRNGYTVAHLREVLAEDQRTHELDIEIEYADNRILLRGEVPVMERREAVESIVRETLPDCQVENQIRVAFYSEPSDTEEFT
jgi:predicted nucleotidyltransferase